MDGVSKTEAVTPPTPQAMPPSTSSAHVPGKWNLAHRVFSFPALLGALMVSTVFALMRRGLSDPDIWWHLHNAEYLLTNHKFIRADLYSFTLYGYPWVNPEWLGEIPFYLAWRAWGLIGIKLVSILAAEAVFLGLFYLCDKSSGNVKASALACYFVVFLATVNFGPRTILFGYCFLLALLIVLERFRSQGRAPLWLLPPLFCLWANTHGSWLIGLVVFGLIVASGLVEGKWGRVEAARWSPTQLRNLLFTMGGCVVALFVNPYGLKLIRWSVEFPFRLKLSVENIEEWQSVNFHDPRGKILFALILALILGALMTRHQWKLHELVLALCGLYSGLTHIRFLFLAAILIAPLLAKLLDVVPPYRREIDKPALNALLIVGMLVFIIRGFPSNVQLEESVEKDYPAEVLPYLESHPPSGPVLNAYLWGGYLGWRDRNLRCFIDSRVDIFEYAGVLKDYLDVIGIKAPYAVLDKYRIRYVLFPLNEPLTYVLSHDPNWKVVFAGKMSIMFERAKG